MIIVVFAVLGAIAGVLLEALARRCPPALDALAERVNALLPQTQCAQCGYAGCRPYAEAIASGEAGINQCPPGGGETVAALARLLDAQPAPVDPRFGLTKAAAVAFIDEARCIGCALCLPACPVDAIVGAPRFTHTVVAPNCTGCELCLAPCPVDCITLEAPFGVGREDAP